ncbi:MAG TPA: type II toxin-antitoxin system VapC family toxin [Alphaproteobacteria bacterium]|nr:type II toxin-antitoxin system VapC family toxin [Alphaproteobacteria bacterium]
MIERVLDASAVIAFLRGEPGAEIVGTAIEGSGISAVNLSEVVSWLARHDYDDENMASTLEGLAMEVVPFNADLAVESGKLERGRRRSGISLGDRCCLATARALAVPVLTADRAWAKLKLGVEIELIR